MHIAKDYKTTTKELKERIEHFKNSGCSLF